MVGRLRLLEDERETQGREKKKRTIDKKTAKLALLFHSFLWNLW